MIELRRVPKNSPALLADMAAHYSKPRSFVARSLCYEVRWGGVLYGHTVAGSAGRHLAGRGEFFGMPGRNPYLEGIISNVFFRVSTGRIPAGTSRRES